MASRFPELKFFSGRSNLELAKKMNNFNLANIIFDDFANGELKVKLTESVRGDDVFIFQTAAPPNPEKWMMELFIIAHTAQKASAKRITAVIPYIYGSRQDRKTEPRTPITIQLIGSLLAASGINRIITVSLHNHASEAAFNSILVDNISSSIVFYSVLEKIITNDTIVLSPDTGGVGRAKSYANKFKSELGFCYKIRKEKGKPTIFAFVGDVKGKDVIIIDDIIDTGETLNNIISATKEKGANKIYVCATHAILSNQAKERLNGSFVDKIYITDSIHHQDLPEKFEVVSLSEILYKTIIAVYKDASVGNLLEASL